MTAMVLVGGILLQDACVLLGKRAANRAFYPGVWDVCGGHVELNESPEEALVRELQEELGITATRFTKLAVLHGMASEQDDKYEYHLYGVAAWTGIPQNVQPEEHSEIRWVPLEEAATLDLADPAYRQLFRQIAADGISS